MGSSRPCFHVDGQTEYSRLQGHALYLVGPARRSVLRTVKTDWNNHRRSVSNAIDAFEPSIERQTAAIQREMIKWFCSMTMLDSMLRKWSRHTWKHWNGKSYLTHHILQTLLPLTITYFDQWHGWPALPVLWRSKKLDRFVDSLKRPVFSTRDSCARKMGENSDQRWTILWIINV